MTFSVIDVETTGLSAKTGDRILEIGIVRLTDDGEPIETLNTLINPEIKVRATHVHGITDEMVRDAPRFRDIMLHLCSLLNGTVIAAHNASFDLGFLREEFRRSGTSLPFISPVCTLILARKYLTSLSSRSLASCRQFLDLPDDGAHNAIADARSAAYLLKHFIRNFRPEIKAKAFRSALLDDEPALKPRFTHGERE